MNNFIIHHSSFIIKICGITNFDDGIHALRAGADWLGFIRWEASKRFRPATQYARLIARLRAEAPRPFEAVGVYVNAEREAIERDADALGLDRIQLHGDEPPELARALGRPVLKALRLRDADSVGLADQYEEIDLLTDAFDDQLFGGTGRSYDYSWLSGLVARRRVIVAGGLTPANVGEVIGALRPWGVDVSSGVERAPGYKDAEKVAAFIAAARAACAQ